MEALPSDGSDVEGTVMRMRSRRKRPTRLSLRRRPIEAVDVVKPVFQSLDDSHQGGIGAWSAPERSHATGESPVVSGHRRQDSSNESSTASSASLSSMIHHGRWPSFDTTVPSSSGHKRRKSNFDDVPTDLSFAYETGAYETGPPAFISPWSGEPLTTVQDRTGSFVAALATAPLARGSTVAMPAPLSTHFREPDSASIRLARARAQSIPNLRAAAASSVYPLPRAAPISHRREVTADRGRPRERRVLRLEPEGYSSLVAPKPSLLPRWSWEAEDVPSWTSHYGQTNDAERSQWSSQTSIGRRQQRSRRPRADRLDLRTPSQPLGRQPASIEVPSSFGFLLRRRKRANSAPAPVLKRDAATQTSEDDLLAIRQPRPRQRSSSLSHLRAWERRARNGEIYRAPSRPAPLPPARRRKPSEPGLRSPLTVAFALPVSKPQPSPLEQLAVPDVTSDIARQHTPEQLTLLGDYFAASNQESAPIDARDDFDGLNTAPSSPISFPRGSLDQAPSTALTTMPVTADSSPPDKSPPLSEVALTTEAPLARPAMTATDTTESFATAQSDLTVMPSDNDDEVRLPDVQLRTSAHFDAYSLPRSLEIESRHPSYIDFDSSPAPPVRTRVRQATDELMARWSFLDTDSSPVRRASGSGTESSSQTPAFDGMLQALRSEAPHDSLRLPARASSNGSLANMSELGDRLDSFPRPPPTVQETNTSPLHFVERRSLPPSNSPPQVRIPEPPSPRSGSPLEGAHPRSFDTLGLAYGAVDQPIAVSHAH